MQEEYAKILSWSFLSQKSNSKYIFNNRWFAKLHIQGQSNVLRTTKLYGYHKNNEFYMYINDDLRKSIIAELQLEGNWGEFEFINFMNEMNNMLPLTVINNDKVKTFRKNKDIICKLNVVNESEKTVFIGSKKLSKGAPQERSLRKLYMYVDVDYTTINDYINISKLQNKTIAWTTSEHCKKTADICQFLYKEQPH